MFAVLRIVFVLLLLGFGWAGWLSLPENARYLVAANDALAAQYRDWPAAGVLYRAGSGAVVLALIAKLKVHINQ